MANKLYLSSKSTDCKRNDFDCKIIFDNRTYFTCKKDNYLIIEKSWEKESFQTHVADIITYLFENFTVELELYKKRNEEEQKEMEKFEKIKKNLGEDSLFQGRLYLSLEELNENQIDRIISIIKEP